MRTVSFVVNLSDVYTLDAGSLALSGPFRSASLVDGHAVVDRNGILYTGDGRMQNANGTIGFVNDLPQNGGVARMYGNSVLYFCRPAGVYQVAGGVAFPRPDLFETFDPETDIARDGTYYSAGEDQISQASILDGSYTLQQLSGDQGRTPILQEGTENIVPGGGSRTSNPWLDIDVTAPALDSSGQGGSFVYCAGFNESTNTEADLLGLGRHNFYFLRAPTGHLDQWEWLGATFVPLFGEFPDTYPEGCSGIISWPYYFVAPGDVSPGELGRPPAIFRYNLVTGESVIAWQSTYDLVRTVDMLHGGGLPVGVPPLRQWQRSDTAGRVGQVTTNQGSLRQGVANSYL